MAFKFSNNARAVLTEVLEISGTTLYIDEGDADKFAEPTGADVQRCVLRDDTEDFELVDIDVNDLTGALVVVRARESTTQKEWSPGTIIEQYLSKAVLESFQ